VDEIVDKCGDEHGLAGASETSDAEAHRRGDEAESAVADVGEHQARFVCNRR